MAITEMQQLDATIASLETSLAALKLQRDGIKSNMSSPAVSLVPSPAHDPTSGGSLSREKLLEIHGRVGKKTGPASDQFNGTVSPPKVDELNKAMTELGMTPTGNAQEKYAALKAKWNDLWKKAPASASVAVVSPAPAPTGSTTTSSSSGTGSQNISPVLREIHNKVGKKSGPVNGRFNPLTNPPLVSEMDKAFLQMGQNVPSCSAKDKYEALQNAWNSKASA